MRHRHRWLPTEHFAAPPGVTVWAPNSLPGANSSSTRTITWLAKKGTSRGSESHRYFFSWGNSSPTPAVQYSLPNGIIYDLDIRWSARLTSGSGNSGSGRIVLSAMATSSTAAILTASVLLAPSPGPAVTVTTPAGSLLEVNVAGQSSSGAWDFQIDVDIIPN